MQEPQQARGLSGWWRRTRQAGAERRARRELAAELYNRLVGEARSPHFYAELGVPDTSDGRFEMIGLHAVLVMRRLRAMPDGPEIAQELFDLMFADMDRGLRELGVGDLSVGKYVKKMAAGFLHRAQALDEPLARGDGAAITPVLLRNLYVTGEEPAPEQVAALSAHLLGWSRALDAFEDAGLLRGELPPGRP
ncbi:ubiquinol-cytochrome C chaperone family protein [Marinimicrococcus flavescens]|uniref:Ubiquinol-cytochrome C chaperone family protein n=1 Tax=Marinimicrococcus flavescens TaxID=3031815 RepID=A0AAP3V231_9PROT|nr:ubiquinol-cytochrome C chaperone family protein [Marinimicrococcus flavescens]